MKEEKKEKLKGKWAEMSAKKKAKFIELSLAEKKEYDVSN